MSFTMNESECPILKERKEMIAKADEMIKDLASRKEKVIELLNSDLMSEDAKWENIKASPLDQTGGNIAINKMMKSSEPALEQFSNDIVNIKTKIILILSNLNESEEDDMSMLSEEQEGSSSPSNKFMMIIQGIQSMSEWSSSVLDGWIGYHMTRMQLLQAGSANAVDLLSIKMAKEMKSMLNDLLFYYLMLEDIVLDATGAVMETPKTPGYCGLYV